MTETIRERRRSPFYLKEDTFDAILMSVAGIATSEPCAVESRLEMDCAIVEEPPSETSCLSCDSCRKISANAVVDVVDSRTWKIRFVLGSTAAYS
jgi:hypothetical protein